MISAKEALERLKEGNQRFVSGEHSIDTINKQAHRASFVDDHTPFAIILGCSDARVPAEIVFDQGIGDLFVIRVAGNIVASSQIGSVEFAVERLHVPLVVVLGHTGCGAVMATIDELENPSDEKSLNLLSIVNRIRPTIEPLFETELSKDPDRLLESAIRANIRAATNHLRHGSQLVEQFIDKDKLIVVGAEYSLATGKVDFFDGI